MKTADVGLTDEELRIKAAELAGWLKPAKKLVNSEQRICLGPGHEEYLWQSPGGSLYYAPPDYLNDIEEAWRLWQIALSSDWFWDFCEWLKKLGSSTESESWNFTVVMGHLSPGLITRAFVLACVGNNVPA